MISWGMSVVLIVLTLLIGTCGTALAADVESKKAPPVYRPPIRGAPVGRVGGGTRSTSTGPVNIAVLAPDHLGLTGQEQPTLYWFLDRPTAHEVEVTLIEADGVKPLFERRLPAPAPGIHAFSLRDAGVHLRPGVRYRWFVAVVVDPSYRSKDILSGAVIERVTSGTPDRPDSPATADALAAAGLWYDALMALSKQVETRPDDSTPRQHRQALLEQIGLGDVARFDREH